MTGMTEQEVTTPALPQSTSVSIETLAGVIN